MALPHLINSIYWDLGDEVSKPKLTSTNYTTQSLRPIDPRPQTSGNTYQGQISLHESEQRFKPYYPSRNQGLFQRPSPPSRFADVNRYTIHYLSDSDRERYEVYQINSLATFMSPPIPRDRSQKPLIPPSRYLKPLAEPLTLTFLRLPLEIRHQIYSYMDSPAPRTVHVSLVNDHPRDSTNYKLYFKAVNTRVPKLLHISRETRAYGLETYKAAFTNYYGDGTVHSQVYVNPKLDIVVLELPLDVKRYPKVRQGVLDTTTSDLASPWRDETHTLYRYSNFLWAHADEWAVEESEDPDDGWGYDVRYNAYLVVVPKGKGRDTEEEWEKTIDMKDVDTWEYECRRVGPVVLPPYVVRDTVSLPRDCEAYLGKLVEALESDPVALRRPLGESPNRFWE